MARWLQDSPLGPLLVATSGAGVCRIGLDQAPPPGGVDGGPEPEVAAALDRYFAGDLDALDGLAVDLSGRTPFSREVLGALRSVGLGSLTTYGALARSVARPAAARAVGQAVGANPLPLVVPCHRVVAGDGSLGGYSGGLDRKRWLLAHEGYGRLGGGWEPRRRTRPPPSAPVSGPDRAQASVRAGSSTPWRRR